MSGNQKPEGYDATIYYTPEANIENAQLIVSQVGEDTNWKMCVDSVVNGHVSAKVDTKQPPSLSSVLFHRHFRPIMCGTSQLYVCEGSS